MLYGKHGPFTEQVAREILVSKTNAILHLTKLPTEEYAILFHGVWDLCQFCELQGDARGKSEIEAVPYSEMIFKGATDYEIRRTLSILNEFIDGKVLSLPDGYRIGMGEDLSIGYLASSEGKDDWVLGLSTMDLKQLNGILNKYNIGFSIPG